MADVVAKIKLTDGSDLSVGKSFISSLKSVSESTSDAGSINYGTLANTGSIEIQDGNGSISKLIDDGSLPISDLDVKVEINGEVFQQHITTDSDYNTEDNTLNISLSNFIKDFDILKYKGFQYPDGSRKLYEIFVDVLNSYFNTTVANIDAMFDDDVLEYIKNISIEFPYVEYGKTYREVIDNLCTIAQLNMFITKENKPRFISARPVYNSNDPVTDLTWKNIVGDLQYTKTLKNKFDGVEISSSRPISEVFYDAVVYSEDALSTTNISQTMNLSEFNSKSGNNRGFNAGRIEDTKLNYTIIYLSATKIKNYYVEGDLYINKSANDNLSNILKIKNTLWDADGNPLFVIHYDKYEDSSVSAVINSDTGVASSFNSTNLKFVGDGAGYIDQSVTHSFSPSGYTNKTTSTATETDGSYISVSLSGDTYKVHYKILCGQDVVYFGGEWSDTYILVPPTSADVSCYGKFTRYKPKSIEFSLYGNKREISFKEVSSSTENIENKKVKATVRPNNLLQTKTTYKGEMIADVIKRNIIDDYRKGISDGKLILNKDLVEIGDLIKYPNDRRVWRVVGKEFHYDGEYLFPISVMQCFKPYAKSGLFDDYGEVIYNWQELVDKKLITIEDGVLESVNVTDKGVLKIDDSITGLGFRILRDGNATGLELNSLITEIPDSSLAYSKELINFDSGNNVTIIGSGAIRGCDNLKKIIIGESVTDIGSVAFAENPKMESLIIKSSVLVDDGLSYDKLRESGSMSGGINIIMDGQLELIPKAFFENRNGNNYINHIEIKSNRLKTIEDRAFSGTAIKSINLPHTLETIGQSVFASTGLINVDIPDSVLTIGNGCFDSCKQLESVKLPNTLTKLEDNVFRYCTSLKEVIIPDSVTEIGRSVFQHCIGMEKMEIPIPFVGEHLSFGITDIIYESTSEYPVHAPQSLKTIVLKKGSVSEVPYKCFENCEAVEEVIIKSGITRISNNAFDGASGLKRVVFEDTEGWKIVGKTVDVSDPEQNAILLTETYLSSSWTKS